MDCSEIQLKLTDFEEGNLEPAEWEAIQSHLKSCQNCASMRQRLNKAWEGLGELPAADPDSFALKRFLDKLHARKAKRKISYWAAAATVLLVAGLGFWFRPVQEPRPLTSVPSINIAFSASPVFPDFTEDFATENSQTGSSTQTGNIEEFSEFELGRIDGPFQESEFKFQKEVAP